MASSQIDLHRQGKAGTLTDTEVASSAGINITKLSKTVVATDGTNPMAANLAMGANRITGLATPTTSTDAATKQYVDSSKTYYTRFLGMGA